MFWGDFVLSAAHIMNRMPLVPLNNITPYEKLYGTKPSYESFKSVWLLMFCINTQRDRHKLVPRADPCTFIGYSLNQKGYRLYNLKLNLPLSQEM